MEGDSLTLCWSTLSGGRYAHQPVRVGMIAVVNPTRRRPTLIEFHAGQGAASNLDEIQQPVAILETEQHVPF